MSGLAGEAMGQLRLVLYLATYTNTTPISIAAARTEVIFWRGAPGDSD